MVLTNVPDLKLLITFLDPDPQTENQEFGSGSFCSQEMVKKGVNFGKYEDTNGIKS
jgi:hypothetical protein